MPPTIFDAATDGHGGRREEARRDRGTRGRCSVDAGPSASPAVCFTGRRPHRREPGGVGEARCRPHRALALRVSNDDRLGQDRAERALEV
ncbi:hypothetical protein [Microtetraspora malaysiensis]|uniref:Uncharacterized protein n=1 Tax=Microtetraspora malaysiensis TaxID=161358 RepID=A0ABW6SW40_9ACTN